MRRSAMIIRRLSLFVLALGLGARALAQTMPERLRAELDQLPHPRSVADFQAAPCLSHVNQNKTSFCWSFATCSFLEAEMARLANASGRTLHFERPAGGYAQLGSIF